MTAAERWASELAAWAIPDHIMAQAPESPWVFTPALFRAPAEPGPDTPSRLRALQALPDRGSVLDVGCGGGAAGLALVPPAARVTGFDQSEELLALFTERASELGGEQETVQGSWPDDAALVGPADVVVCHHVAYNVPRLGAFAGELTSHARARVVMELSGQHPRAGVNHLRETRVASIRRYLCLPAKRDPEIDALLGDEPGTPGETVTLWWAGTA